MWQQLSTLLYAGSLLATPPAAPTTPVPGTPGMSLTIRRQVEEVRLTFSVDQESGPAKDLPADAFTIYDNDHVVSPTSFSADSDLPLRIGLLVDRSDSVRKGFADEQRAAEQFLRSVLRSAMDSIFLLDFTHQLSFRRPTIGDPVMIAAVSALAPGGQTALYDALRAAARYELMTQVEPQPVRRVIILLSDGEDNDSLYSLDDAISTAQMNDVSIYAITVHAARDYSRGDGVLAALAEATGGRAFVLPNLKRLDTVFSAIQEELRSQYVASFHPADSKQCGYHSLSIRAHDRALRVRARHGYFACQF